MDRTIKSPESGSAERKRAYWRSRRGMTELEQILLPFVMARYEQLSPADQALYAQLLDEEDWDLYDWLQSRAAPPAQFEALVQAIVRTGQQDDAPV
jgi:antitoxin CptB